VIVNIIHILEAFSYAIFVQLCNSWQKFQLTGSVARSLCDSWTPCP